MTLLEKPNADPQPARGWRGVTRANASQNDAPQNGVNLKFSFVGANPAPHLEPFDRLDTHVSYFLGSNASQWHPDVPVWGGVRYKEIYPNIDLELTSENGQLVQRLVARAGANLEAVQLRVEGADALAVDDVGLHVKTAVGEYVLPLFELRGAASDRAPQPALAENVVRAPFAKSAISNQQPEISNARGLRYSTFLGGRSEESSSAIALDVDGHAYVTGHTASRNFPTTPGAFQTALRGRYSNAFVAKLNAAGTALVYSTFLGGGWSAWGDDIALDANGNAYVTGTADNSFPITPGAFQTTCSGPLLNFCVFVTKLNATGAVLEYSTFLGGSGQDNGNDIALDADRNAYVTGYTYSSDFPTTPGAFQTTLHGYYDAFVSKMKPVLVDCTAKPAAPKLSRPQNGGSVKRTPVWLNWNTANCTQTYNIVVRKDSSTGRQVQAQKKMNVARFLTKPLQSGKTYYWQVEACNTFSCTKSEWWHFTVK